MRPTDENQSPSMRPNLMSPRRTSGEDSILAMLERDSGRKRGTGARPGGRLAWYGASAAMAIALTGMLVWLAAGNDGRQADGAGLALDHAILASSGASPAGLGHGASSSGASDLAPAVRQVAMATTMAPISAPPAPRPASAAVIVDQQSGESVPPMRLLKPAPGKPAPIRVPVPGATAPAARPAARTTAPASRPTASSHGELRHAARPATAAPVRARPPVAARNTVRPGAAKTQGTPNPAKKADGHVDADVALISAVILHANGHAPEGSQMTELLCPNDACKAKPARD